MPPADPHDTTGHDVARRHGYWDVAQAAWVMHVPPVAAQRTQEPTELPAGASAAVGP